MRYYYISGPITNATQEQLEAFGKVSGMLELRGIDYFNPLETPEPPEGTHVWQYYMKRSLSELCECDAIVTLPGWEDSRGCQLEVFVAQNLGIKIIPFESL
jgi:hypothetical protein